MRAVFFDLDETLFDHRSAVRVGAAALARELGHRDLAAAVDLWVSLEQHFFDRYLAGELSFLEQRRARVRGLAADVARELDDAEADAAFATYFSHYQASWVAFPDVDACLARLRALPGLRLGVVTNGDRDGQRAKLARLGLLDLLDVVVTADEAGCAKPDPRIYREACDRAGVPPEDAVMVGDRLDADAEGARAAGLLGVWLDRGRSDQLKPTGIRPHSGDLARVGLDRAERDGATSDRAGTSGVESYEERSDVMSVGGHDGSRLVRISSLTELPALLVGTSGGRKA